MSSTLILLGNTVAQFLNIYMILIFIRILLSWFPNVNMYEGPLSVIPQLTDPYLNVFRSFIPPLGGIDFSPIIAIFLLQFVAQLVPGLIYSLV